MSSIHRERQFKKKQVSWDCMNSDTCICKVGHKDQTEVSTDEIALLSKLIAFGIWTSKQNITSVKNTGKMIYPHANFVGYEITFNQYVSPHKNPFNDQNTNTLIFVFTILYSIFSFDHKEASV